LKGRQLNTGRSLDIRPTSSLVRESIFNILGNIRDDKVLDLYSGAGTLGFEAISRGAGSVTFVDNNVEAIGIIRMNAQLFLEASLNIERQDSMSFLSNCGIYDIILADPPYGKANLDDLAQRSMKRLKRYGIILLKPPRMKIGNRLGLELKPMVILN
jgi:16S rRNA (guanine(966)-N(2))-methyltransferase RsmD